MGLSGLTELYPKIRLKLSLTKLSSASRIPIGLRQAQPERNEKPIYDFTLEYRSFHSVDVLRPSGQL